MNSRTIGIILTVVTVLCCACPGLITCAFGGAIAAGMPLNTELNGVTSTETYPIGVGIAMICGSLFMILIPILVGFFTLRKKPESAAVISNVP